MSDGGGGTNGNSGNTTDNGTAEAELIAFPARHGQRNERPTDHLVANRALIVRRSLLATAVGGLIPIPVMDDYLAGRVRAGMLMQIAERRRVDLASSSAELLADPREGTTVRNATLTAATLVALKLAWRKFFALLAVGRRAEDMATTFQLGTLFDHFCAKLHVGSGLDRQGAFQLRAVAHAAIGDSERDAVVAVFRDGSRLLARSVLEAPGWVSDRLQRAVQDYVATGGNPNAVPPPEPALGEEEARWLDRAAAAVDHGLSRIGTGYLERLIASFDRRFAEETARAAEAAARAQAKSEATSKATSEASPGGGGAAAPPPRTPPDR